jgi:diguanylate cyclase (GGDEF)-like protein
MSLMLHVDRFGAALTRRNPVRWLMATAVVALVAIALATTMAIGSFRDRALQSGQRQLENTLVLLNRHFDAQFGELTRIAGDLDAGLRSSGIATAEDFSRRMASHDAYLQLKTKLDAGATGSLNIFDADGRLLNTTPSWPAPRADAGERDYFRALKASAAGSATEIVAPIRDRITGRWQTLFARRLNGPNGEFLGVVSRQVEASQFEDFFASVALGPDSSILMLHQNGTLLARYPHAADMNGQKMQPNGTFESLRPDRPTTLRTTSPFDGKQRLTSAWQLQHFPIVLVATLSIDAALADWRAQTRLMIAAAATMASIVCGLLLIAIRQVKRQHRTAQAERTLEKTRLDTAINNMTQGLMLFDADARVVVVNQRYFEMYNPPAGAIGPGTPLRDVVSHFKATRDRYRNLDEHCSAVLEAVKTRQALTLNLPDGRVIQLQVQPIADGGWVTTHEDITERHRIDARLAHLAHYDPLTDLPNRTLFHDLFGNELALTAGGRHCALIYIDMDEFKGVNDALGHSVGDALLMAVAQRLKRCIGPANVVARLGGDEFAIMQTDVKSKDQTIALVEQIHDALREPFECLRHRLLTDASIGIALAPQDGTDLDQLLRNADLAMYTAKADGRRTFRFFEPEMDARVQARRLLEHDLREAVADGDFRKGGFDVHYQPLLRLDSDAISGCEALLRWQHPLRGLISPAEFIPIAEEIGVINQLGEWVLATACTEAATWPDHIKIAVNVSPIQFRSQTLALRVVAALGASGLSPQRLELEITEAVLIRDDDAALAILHRLRALGVRIALDDFGTGYSSLSYLQRFPFDKIKIDRAFVTDITGPNGASSIVQAVVNIAASRTMTTTAEGVETEAQKTLLRTLGCTEMQGWLFSAAKPAAEVRALIAAHGAARKVA